jgi:hypothetical protein
VHLHHHLNQLNSLKQNFGCVVCNTLLKQHTKRDHPSCFDNSSIINMLLVCKKQRSVYERIRPISSATTAVTLMNSSILVVGLLPFNVAGAVVAQKKKAD